MVIWVLIPLLSGEWGILSLVHHTDVIKDIMGTANTSNLSQLENKTWDGSPLHPISLQGFFVSSLCLPPTGIAWCSADVFLFFSLPVLFLPSDPPFPYFPGRKKELIVKIRSTLLIPGLFPSSFNCFPAPCLSAETTRHVPLQCSLHVPLGISPAE